jgi:4-oxalocrotonate tautomerase family enzyme
MPVIEITMGKVGTEIKRSLIERLSAEAIDITKIPAAEFTVFVHELEYESIGRGGRTLADLRAEKK